MHRREISLRNGYPLGDEAYPEPFLAGGCMIALRLAEVGTTTICARCCARKSDAFLGS